jgi:hypothetical protein
MFLIDGSLITADRSDILSGKISKGASLQLSNATIPSEALAALRPQPSMNYELAWNRLMQEPKIQEDRIAIRRPHGVLDEIRGIALAISSEQVDFKIDGELYKIPHEKIEGVIFASLSSSFIEESTPSHWQVEVPQGFLECREILPDNITAKFIEVTTLAGAKIKLPVGLPVKVDRSRALALTLNDMKISHSRVPEFSEYAKSLPISERPLSLAPKPYAVTGSGIDASLRVYGGVSLEIEIPPGEHAFIFEPKFKRNAPFSFSFHYKGNNLPYTEIYTQERFPKPEDIINLRNELPLIGPGTLQIRVGETGTEMDFEGVIMVPGA